MPGAVLFATALKLDAAGAPPVGMRDRNLGTKQQQAIGIGLLAGGGAVAAPGGELSKRVEAMRFDSRWSPSSNVES